MRRPRAPIMLALVTLLGSACASFDSGNGARIGASATTTTTTSTTTVPSAPPSPLPASAPPPAATPPRPSSPATSSSRSGGVSAAPEPSAPDAFAPARAAPGAFATVLVRPQPAARLVLEVILEQGAEPSPGTVAHLVRVLQESSGKGVSVATVAVPPGAGAINPDGIRALADRYGVAPQGNGQAVIRFLFLGGQLQGEDAALGAAVRGDTAAVFVNQLRRSSSPLVSAPALEAAVATHELGHLLGLVDLVLATGRADPEHPGHSSNRASVMYWAVESDLVTSALTGPLPADFDAADRADLAAIRSGR
ncbi:MAG: hypothetical protein ABIS21_08615 [Acidimicrobiales bacterium]